MRKSLALAGALWMLGGAGAMGANHVIVESKAVAPGATGVQVGVYVENDISLNGLVIPLEFREITTAGAFPTNTLTVDPANRLTTSLVGFVTKNFYPAEDNPNPNFCGGVGFSTSGALDFISPDAFLYSAISVGDPCLAVGTDGAPPGGTPSLIISFDVTNVDGLFVIDTTCVTPANNLLYVDCATSDPVVPTFAAGQITVGTPAFPPVVDDIPDQTIEEGGSFATIALDDFVADIDNTDSEISWVASGQSALSVTIGPGRVATITTPNPDWSGAETITFTATDPSVQSDADAATFTVNPVNDPPVLNPIGPRAVLAGKFLAFTVSASDIDNPTLIMTMENGPSGSLFADSPPANGTFNWATGCVDEGTHLVTFIASDGILADSEVVAITVEPNPDFLNITPDSLDFTFEFEGTPPSAQNFQISDPGCGELGWTAVASEPWVVLSADNGITPTAIAVDIDTTGLVGGEYDAVISFIEANPARSPEVVQVDVPIHLSVVAQLCLCPCFGDPVCDSVPNVLDITNVINVVFRSAFPLGTVTCTTFMTDVDCDCILNVLDVTLIIDHVFRGSTAPYCGEEGPCGQEEHVLPCAGF
jgi:hypothetical protein